MNIDAAGEHLIASFEGFRPDGTGTLAGSRRSGSATPVRYRPGSPRRSPLLRDIRFWKLLPSSAVNTVNEAVKVSLGVLPDHARARADACYSLAFNIGAGAFAESSLVRVINQRAPPGIGMRWRPTGWSGIMLMVIVGLLTRRQAELRIFVPGVM